MHHRNQPLQLPTNHTVIQSVPACHINKLHMKAPRPSLHGLSRGKRSSRCGGHSTDGWSCVPSRRLAAALSAVPYAVHTVLLDQVQAWNVEMWTANPAVKSVEYQEATLQQT